MMLEEREPLEDEDEEEEFSEYEDHISVNSESDSEYEDEDETDHQAAPQVEKYGCQKMQHTHSKTLPLICCIGWHE